MTGKSSLGNAIRRNDPDRVRRLLGEDPSVLDAPVDGIDPFSLALYLRRTEIVRVMIEASADLVAAESLYRRTPLHLAALAGDAEMVELLLLHGGDPNARDEKGRTPLHLYVEENYGPESGVIGALVSGGADASAKDDAGATPLHYAACRSASCAEALIQAGADVKAASSDGATPLHTAAFGHNEQQVRLLAQAGAGLDAQNKEGLTPLIEAVDRLSLREARRLAKPPEKRGRPPKLRSTVEVLLECGATLDVYCAAVLGRLNLVRRFVEEVPELVHRRFYRGRTLLHAATRLAQRPLMKFLLDHGADPNARDDQNDTPLDSAAFWGHAQTLEILLKKDASTEAPPGEYPPLYWACSMGNRRSALKLIAAGADVRATIPGGETPLHVAAEKGLLDVVTELIRRGADMNAATESGRTPLLEALFQCRDDLACFLIETGADVVGRGEHFLLHTAARRWCPRAVELMVSRGAPIDTTDEDGATPLHLAAAGDEIKMMEIFAAAGAKIDPRDNSGRTPLHCAGPKAAQWLIRAGAEVEARDNDGRTPLHYMSPGMYPPKLTVLLRHGADIDAIDNQGRTALHIAAEDERCDGIETLLAHHANVNARDDKGDTPLACALRARRRKNSQLLRQHGGVE